MDLSVHLVWLSASLQEQDNPDGCQAQDMGWNSEKSGVPGWEQDMVKSGMGMGLQVPGMAM
jgi:hypothetical protein